MRTLTSTCYARNILNQTPEINHSDFRVHLRCPWALFSQPFKNISHMHVWSRPGRGEKQAHGHPAGRPTVQARMRKRSLLSTQSTHSGMHELERAMRGASGCDKQLTSKPLRIHMAFMAAAMLGPRIPKKVRSTTPELEHGHL